MRSIPFGPNAPSGLPVLITIQLGLTTLRLTTADRDLTNADGTFVMVPGADLTGYQALSDGSAANADLTVNSVPNGLFLPGDGLRGILDEWPIKIELVDPSNPASTYLLLDGTIVGSVDEDANGRLVIAANGPLRQIHEQPICEHFSLVCRADLGDDRCKVPILLNKARDTYDILRSTDYVRADFEAGVLTEPGLLTVTQAYGRVIIGTSGTIDDYENVHFECTTAGTTAATAPTFPTNVGDTVVDGTMTWTCRNAWFRHARAQAIDSFTIQITNLTEPRATDATWYVDGGLFIRSGILSDYPKLTIKAWDPASQQATLFLPVQPSDIPAGTQCELQPGCNRTRIHCNTRFNNIVNGRFETFVPPPDAIFSV